LDRINKHQFARQLTRKKVKAIEKLSETSTVYDRGAMAEEARLEETPSGLAPASDGWFVVNVRDAAWVRHPALEAACRFESSEGRFSNHGVNIRVLQPAQPNALYHSEATQEDFLVLAGECVLLVDGDERPAKAWDFAHCPPNVEHVFVGAGDGPCVILMVGTRAEDPGLRYPVSELAGRHGASAEVETTSGQEAYASYERPEPGRPEGWEGLPWSR
jgi:uncharacterized cupin superfamily protein